MSENLEVLIKSAEEIGNLRERAKILGFIRGQIILFEKKIMDLTWALDDVNKDREEVEQEIKYAEVAKITLQTLLKTIEVKL